MSSTVTPLNATEDAALNGEKKEAVDDEQDDFNGNSPKRYKIVPKSLYLSWETMYVSFYILWARNDFGCQNMEMS